MAIADVDLVRAVLKRFPGAEIVDARQADAGLRPSRAAAFTWAELRKVAADEANRIDAAQEALVAAGDRVEPDPGQLARRDAFETLARLVDRVRSDDVIVDRLKQLAPTKKP